MPWTEVAAVSARSLNLSVRRAREAVDALEAAFIWEESPQGVNYWCDVVRNLRALIEEHEAESTAAQEPTP